jgi:hypothetical protein
MAITTREAREEILQELATAVESLALALACVGAAYEAVSVTAADRLESAVYSPVQRAYGRAMRTHNAFARFAGLEERRFEQPAPGRTSQGAKAFIERAVVACAEADRTLSELQDSMKPTEFGDPELRAGIVEVRGLISGVTVAAREFLRTLGR